MTPDPATLLSPAITAFPNYSGVFRALADLIVAQAPATPVAPVTPVTPVTPVAPVTPVSPSTPAALSIVAGRFAMLGGAGPINSFDFGDGAAPFRTLRGYLAAHVYDTPGSYTATVSPAGQTATKTAVTVTADTRPQVTLAASADLAAAIAQATTPTILLLPSGATFDVKAPVTISADGITLRAASTTGPAPRIRRIASVGSYTTLGILGADISIEGIEFDSDQPLKTGANTKVGVYAISAGGHNLLVRNCTFRNIDDGVHCQAQARGLVVLNCTYTDELRGCGVWLDAMQNAALLGITAAGSVCEHIVRFEGAQNILIDGGDFNNHDGKETITIRSGDCVAVAGNTLRAWARVSQGVQAAPAIYCKSILFAGNHFAGLHPGGSWLTINPGSQSVLVDSNAFDVDTQQVSVALQAPVTDITLTANQLCLTTGTTTCKPLVAPFGNPLFSETGTKLVPAATS